MCTRQAAASGESAVWVMQFCVIMPHR